MSEFGPVGEIVEKNVEEIQFAGFRFTGEYPELGDAFSRVARVAGRFMEEPAIALFYDDEYNPENADMEGGFRVQKDFNRDGVETQILPAIKAIAILHQGSYETLSQSYEKLHSYAKEKGYNLQTPSREIYLKGPGKILKGNPKNYITEIQIPV